MKYLLLLAAAVLSVSISATAVNVTVSQPGNNQQVGTPFTLTANATTNYNITGLARLSRRKQRLHRRGNEFDKCEH